MTDRCELWGKLDSWLDQWRDPELGPDDGANELLALIEGEGWGPRGEASPPGPTMAYEVRTGKDEDGRAWKTIGLVAGDPEDIKAYYAGDTLYNLELKERLIPHITPDRVPERKRLRERQEQLEAELEEIRKKLDY